MKKNKSIITLDIGSQSIKLLELEKTLRGWIVSNFLERLIIPQEGKNRDEIIPELLKEISLEAELKNKSIITFLPRQLCSVKYLRLPSEDYNEISQMISFEAENVFPFSLAKFELGFAIQEVLPDKNSKIIIAAIEKSLVEKLLNQFKKTNLSVERIGLSSLALSKAYLSKNKENAVLIDIGQTATEVNVVYEGNLGFSRSFPVAGVHLTKALMSDLNLSEKEAENSKLEGNWPRDKNLPSVKDWYNRLILEIKRTIEAPLRDRPEVTFSQIILSGGGSKLSGLKEILSSKLNLESKFFAPGGIQVSEEIKKDFLENSYRLPVALGLALEEDGTHPFNFIPREFQNKIGRKKKQKTVIFAAVASIGLIVLLEISLGMVALCHLARKKMLQKNLAKVAPAVTHVMERREEIKLLKNYFKRVSPLEALRGLSEIIPEDILLTRFSLDKNGKGDLAGLTTEHSKISDLIKKLEKSPQFSNIFSRYSRTKAKQGKNLVEFAISFSTEE